MYIQLYKLYLYIHICIWLLPVISIQHFLVVSCSPSTHPLAFTACRCRFGRMWKRGRFERTWAWGPVSWCTWGEKCGEIPEIPGLVMTNVAMERSTIFKNGKPSINGPSIPWLCEITIIYIYIYIYINGGCNEKIIYKCWSFMDFPYIMVLSSRWFGLLYQLEMHYLGNLQGNIFPYLEGP